MTDKRLQRLCDLWKKRIRGLQDWKVTARFVDELPEHGQVGQCGIDDSEWRAEIKILSDVIGLGAEEVVHTLLHELLHISLRGWPVEDGTPEYDEKERVINLLADSLYSAFH